MRAMRAKRMQCVKPCNSNNNFDSITFDLQSCKRDEIYKFFINRVRNNLHVVMSMSPVGDAFRRRCRMFPSLVNCTTIDWFTSWPTEALYSVALGLLTKIAPSMNERIALASTTVFMHKVGKPLNHMRVPAYAVTFCCRPSRMHRFVSTKR